MPQAGGEKAAELAPEVQLQEHQQRIADRVSGENPRLLVYHGLGSGKSLSAIAAAEAAKKIHGGNYGVVVPASLRGNFEKEIAKFTRNSNPEILSYTGLGSGKQFKETPDTLVMDEAARLRNPDAAMTRAALQNAARAKRVMLLTGTPITNEPKDLASLISIIRNEKYDPAQFEKDFVGEKRVWPSFWGFLRGAGPGIKPIMKNGPKLRSLLEGHVDYQPSKTPEGVNVNEETVNVPLSKEQQRIQKAIRTKIPPGFLWKLDQEFPLSREELAKLNSFMTGLRQVSLSTQPFRADKDPLKAFSQSAKLQEAFKRLRENLDADPRRKAIIYSNFVDAGLGPYAAGLAANKIPHGIFHGGIPTKTRLQALKDYNEGKLRALLIGPAGAEGISTRGTSLIQLLDPYWNEARLQQARGRGLRFDSHAGLPEDLKNVAVQRYLSTSEEPGFVGKFMGQRRQRTGDEVIQHMASEKEQLNEQFRNLLREIGTKKKPAEKASELRAFGEKIAENPTITPLKAPQKFPAPAAPRTGGQLPPVYQHPSGALQLGKINYAVEQPEMKNTMIGPRPAGTSAAPREKIVASRPVSPGRDSGPGVLQINHHGAGVGQYDALDSVSRRRAQYALSNPEFAADGSVDHQGTHLAVGERAGLLNPAVGLKTAPKTYEQEKFLGQQVAASDAAVQQGAALPPGTNPHTLVAKACNGNPDGCTPATYARWLNAEQGINAGYAQQLAQAGMTAQQWPYKPPAPPTVAPLNLNKVVMVPAGKLGFGTFAGTRIPGDGGSFGDPYWTDKSPEFSSAHEYRLTRGGDPMNAQHWTDTGVYSDAREVPLPLAGLADEAKEFGRHIGLSPELGGGGAGSYLDKIRDINANPDATYWQKVRGNWARPVGSALQFGRELGGLAWDGAGAGRRAIFGK